MEYIVKVSSEHAGCTLAWDNGKKKETFFSIFDATQAYLDKSEKDDVLYGAEDGNVTHVFDGCKWKHLGDS